MIFYKLNYSFYKWATTNTHITPLIDLHVCNICWLGSIQVSWMMRPNGPFPVRHVMSVPRRPKTPMIPDGHNEHQVPSYLVKPNYGLRLAPPQYPTTPSGGGGNHRGGYVGQLFTPTTLWPICLINWFSYLFHLNSCSLSLCVNARIIPLWEWSCYQMVGATIPRRMSVPLTNLNPLTPI